MSGKENNIFVKSGMPLWFAGDLQKIIVFCSVLLLLALVLFVLKVPYWYVVLWFLAAMCIISLLIWAVGKFSSIVWAAIQVLGNKIDESSPPRCVKTSTWIAVCFLIIFDVFLLFNAFSSTSDEILPSSTKDVIFKIFSIVLLNAYLMERNLNKYIVDITERDGDIYYKGIKMSKMEKAFFKLARTFII